MAVKRELEDSTSLSISELVAYLTRLQRTLRRRIEKSTMRTGTSRKRSRPGSSENYGGSNAIARHCLSMSTVGPCSYQPQIDHMSQT